jgi:hypothetical protein
MQAYPSLCRLQGASGSFGENVHVLVALQSPWLKAPVGGVSCKSLLSL